MKKSCLRVIAWNSRENVFLNRSANKRRNAIFSPIHEVLKFQTFFLLPDKTNAREHFYLLFCTNTQRGRNCDAKIFPKKIEWSCGSSEMKLKQMGKIRLTVIILIDYELPLRVIQNWRWLFRKLRKINISMKVCLGTFKTSFINARYGFQMFTRFVDDINNTLITETVFCLQFLFNQFAVRTFRSFDVVNSKKYFHFW